MDWIFLGIIIVSIILLIGVGYAVFVLFFSNNYGNEVLNLLQYYQNWQWVNPVTTITDQKRNIPYSFQIIPEEHKIRVSYYDDAGYLKGFSTFITAYTIVDSNTLRLEHVETLQNYSQIKPVFPWTLKYIDKNHLLAQISGVSKVLELL